MAKNPFSDPNFGASASTNTSEASNPFADPEFGKPPKPRTLATVANDTVIEVANAAAGGVASIGNFIKPGNAASGWIDKNIIKAGEDAQSDVVKASKQKFRQEVDSADGIAGELGAVGRYVVQNPLLSAAQAAGSFAGPGLAVKGVTGVKALEKFGPKAVEYAGRAAGALTGAAMSGGDAAGTAYELASKAGATEDQAVSAGRQASVIPAIIGGLSGVVGAEGLLAGGKGFAGGTISKALKTGAVEASGEAVEEGVTQYEGQRAAMPYDPSIDPTKGVSAAAGMGAALGGITGAGASLLSGGQNQPADTGQAEREPTTSPGAAGPAQPGPTSPAAPVAPDWATSPGAAASNPYGGIDFTSEVDTSGLSLADPTDTIASRLKPSEVMGLNPSAGALSREVAAFVDAAPFTEVTPIEQRTGIGAQRRLGEQPIIDVDAREVIDPQQTIAARLAGPSQAAPIQQAIAQLPYNPATQGDSLADKAPQAIQAATQRTQAGAAQAEPALTDGYGQAWDSLDAESRASVARAAGARGVLARNVASKGWGDLSPNLRSSISTAIESARSVGTPAIQLGNQPQGASNVGNATAPQAGAVPAAAGAPNALAQGERGTGLSGNGDGVGRVGDGAGQRIAGAGFGEAGIAPVAGRSGVAPTLTQGAAPNVTQAGQPQPAAAGQATPDQGGAGQAGARSQAGGVPAPRSASVEATGVKLGRERNAVLQQLGDALRSGGWQEFTKVRSEISDRYNLSVRQTLDLGTLTAGEVGPLYDLEHAKAFPHKAGRIAHGNAQAPIAPAGLSQEQAAEWMAGWDDGASRVPEAKAAIPAGEVVGEARVVGDQPRLGAEGQQPATELAQTIPARPKARQHPPTVRGSSALAEISRALGGVSPDLLADLSEKVVRNRTSKTGKKTQYTSWDNPAIPGVGPLFRKGGTGDIAEVARVLEESGYLEAGANERDPIGAAQRAQEIIRGELRKGGSTTQVGNADAIDAEMRARLEAEMDAASDPWDDFSFAPDDLDEVGFTDASETARALTEQLIAEAETLGIDTETIREDVARMVGEEASQDEYHAATQEAIRAAVAQAGRTAGQSDASRAGAGNQDGGGTAEQAGREGGQGQRQGGPDREALTLEAQTEEDLRAKAEREDAATSEAAAAKAAEQERLRREAEARDNKARADATVDDFQLGQTADQQMSGMDDMFGGAQDAAPAAGPDAVEQPSAQDATPSPAAKSAKPAAAITDFGEKIGGARKDTATSTGKSGKARNTDERPAWVRRFDVSQIVKSSRAGEEGRWSISDNRTKDWTGQPKRVGGQTFETRESAEAAIPLIAVAQKHRAVPVRQGDGAGYEIWRDVTDRKRVKVVDQVFPTREDAMRYMAENAQAIIETNTTFGEADLPRPPSEQRIGEARRTGNVKDSAFTDVFGFRGVEFGNWNNQDDRQQLLNDAYDGLLDLAEVMYIPPRAISLNGELALAFGARGHGLSGARAHYELDKSVINLTKMNGAGSLAHEWFHALDHYFGRQDGKASAEWVTGKDGTRSFSVSPDTGSSMVTSGTRGERSGMRAEMREAYAALMDVIKYKAESYVEDTARTEKFVAAVRNEVKQQLDDIRRYLADQLDQRYYKRNNKPANAEQLAEFDSVAEKIINGESLELVLGKNEKARSVMSGMRWTNDALNKINDIMKAVRGRQGFNADGNGRLDRLRGSMSHYSSRLKMLAEAQTGGEKTRKVPTQFMMDSKELDQGRGTDYWTTPHELGARAFQGFVEDKIAAHGGQSPFLNYGPDNVGIPTPWGYKRPFPAGIERQAINAALEKLVGTLQTKETDKGVALFSVAPESSPAASVEVASPAGAISQVELDSVIKGALNGWKAVGGDMIATVQSAADLPAEIVQGAKDQGLDLSKVEGVQHRGKVYLVRDNLHGPEHAARVLFHEVLGHLGVKGALSGKTKETMRVLWANIGGLKGVEAMARKIDAGDGKTVWDRLQPYTKGGALTLDRQAIIMDELIAYIAQGNDKRPLTRFKGYLSNLKADVVALLRKLKLNTLADRLSKAGAELDVLALVRDARAAIETGKTRDGQSFTFTTASSAAAGRPSFSQRTTSGNQLPDAVIGHKLGDLNKHPDYAAAKSGDVDAGFRIAMDMVDDAMVEKVRAAAGSADVIVPVVSVEASGRNKIPLAVAQVLADKLGSRADAEIVQINSPKRTAMDGLDRLLNPPLFDGPVQAGAAYVMVDDALTQGGTFASLASHIIDGGGRVAGVVALTGKQYSAKLAPSPELLSQVRDRYQSVEDQFRAATGYRFDALTESEARYLAKHDNAQLVRDRITEAGDAARQRADQGTDQGSQGLTDLGGADTRFSVAPSSAPASWASPAESAFDNLIYKMQDKHIDAKRVVESITKTVGAIKDSLNVYLQEELFHGRAAKRVADFGARELTPMLNQMRMANLSMDEVEEFLHARHAKEANAVIAQRNPGDPGMQDGGSGMTNADADAYFAKLPASQRSKLDAIAKRVDAMIADTRKLYVQYGLEDQAVVDGWTGMFKHYIPLMRENKDGGMGIGQGFSVKGKEVKGRTGSKRKVVDILANIAAQREKVIVRGEKNRVSQALVGLAWANPSKGFWEVRSQAPTERVYDEKLKRVVDRPDPMFKSRDNVVGAKVKDSRGNVTEQFVVFNEDDPRAMRMAAAMKNLDAGNLEGLLGVSAKITRYFSAINTQYNPVFGVVNLVRDVQGAMINLSTTPLAGQQAKIAKDTVSALAGIYGDIRKTRKGGMATSKWAQLWEQMQEDGGTTGYRELFKTSADRGESLKAIINPDAWMDSKWGKVFTADGKLKVPMSVAKEKAGDLFNWLSDYNEAMENGVRLAAYKAALDKGMSRQQAASLSKNLTVNFNRKGQVGMQAGAVYAFFNAAMQGTARIGQTLFDMDGGDIKTLRLSGVGKKVVYGGVLLGVMQALALSAAGFDDEDPPEFLRERSLIIPTGGKTYISIPMPLGLHVIPGLGRHATEFALSGFSEPAERAVSVVGMFADAFNPIGNAGLSMQTVAPTALDPFVALSENRDWTGKPIARTSFNKAEPGHNQWKDTATGFSKTIAEAINWLSGGNEYVAGAFSPTPDQIDYLIAQVGGGVAREVSKVMQTGSSITSGEELPTYKMPLLGRFVGSANGQASQGSAFYANLNKLNALETEIKGLRKDGKYDEAAALVRERPESSLIAFANKAERDVQKLRRDKRELIASDADRDAVRAKEDQITAVMTRLNELTKKRTEATQ